jgi:hypothetical protein
VPRGLLVQATGAQLVPLGIPVRARDSLSGPALGSTSVSPLTVSRSLRSGCDDPTCDRRIGLLLIAAFHGHHDHRWPAVLPPVRYRSSALSIQPATRTDREEADATATALDESERPAHRRHPCNGRDEQERGPAVPLIDELETDGAQLDVHNSSAG